MGKQAIEKLEKEGLKPHFHQLEIDNNESVVAFAKYIKDNYGGLDVLVNNAAIALKVYFNQMLICSRFLIHFSNY